MIDWLCWEGGVIWLVIGWRDLKAAFNPWMDIQTGGRRRRSYIITFSMKVSVFRHSKCIKVYINTLSISEGNGEEVKKDKSDEMR